VFNVVEVLWTIVAMLSVVHHVRIAMKGKMKLRNVPGAVRNVNLMIYTKVYANIVRRTKASEHTN
jgi:hypothetical protein